MSGISIAFLIVYVNDILLIENDVEFLENIKRYLTGAFQYNLGKVVYKLRLIRPSQNTDLDKILKEFKMDQLKKELLPVLQGVK